MMYNGQVAKKCTQQKEQKKKNNDGINEENYLYVSYKTTKKTRKSAV